MGPPCRASLACLTSLFPCRSPPRLPTDGTEGHRALGDTQVGPVLFLRTLCLCSVSITLWTQPRAHLELLPVTRGHMGMLGPPVPLLGSLPQSAEGKHRSQEKQGHSLGRRSQGRLPSPTWYGVDLTTVHTPAPRGACSHSRLLAPPLRSRPGIWVSNNFQWLALVGRGGLMCRGSLVRPSCDTSGSVCWTRS